MKQLYEYHEVKRVNEKIVLSALYIASSFGLLAFLISLGAWSRIENKVFFLLDFLAVAILILTLFFKKHLVLKLQIRILILGILILVFNGVYKQGIFSDSRILLVFVPFLLFMNNSYLKAATIFIALVLAFLSFYFFFREGLLELSTDYAVRASQWYTWLINGILISIVGFTIIIIMRHYLETYDQMLINLRSQNEELQHYRENLEKLVDSRTSDLEAAIEELKAINEELHTKNTIINDQNFELTTTMEDLREAQTKLIQAEKMASLGVLTAGLAHEINNPLNFITGGYYGLNEYFQETGQLENEDVNLLLNSIKTGADRAVNIVKGLTQFSRSDALQREYFELTQVVDNTLIILYNQYKNHIEIVKKYPDERLMVYGSLGQLHQVFMNVLLNAIQAIKDNGLITIEMVRDQRSVIASITDNGHGIAKEHLYKITDPFFTTKEPGEGTGLGLSIAYSVVNEHNGSISFDSEPGKGTTVKVQLPLVG